jgi:hypothetical protein
MGSLADLEPPLRDTHDGECDGLLGAPADVGVLGRGHERELDEALGGEVLREHVRELRLEALQIDPEPFIGRRADRNHTDLFSGHGHPP